MPRRRITERYDIHGIALDIHERMRDLYEHATDKISRSTPSSLGLFKLMEFAAAIDLAPRNRSTELRIWGPERGGHEGKAVHGGADHRGAQGG